MFAIYFVWCVNIYRPIRLILPQTRPMLISGLAGKTAEDKARADMIVDITNDLLPHLVPIYKEQDPDKKVVTVFVMLLLYLIISIFADS